MVFTPAHAPTGIAPFDVRAGDVYCVLDPEAPDRATLEAALRLARLLALATLRDRPVEVDAEAIRVALTGVRQELEAVRRMKASLTSISTTTREIQARPGPPAGRHPGPRHRGGRRAPGRPRARGGSQAQPLDERQ